MRCARTLLALLAAAAMPAADYSAPAGLRPAIRRPGAATIIPGGRIIQPAGELHATGPGPFGLAVSPDGRTVVTANGGPQRFSFTVLERGKEGRWNIRHWLAPKDKEPGAEEDDWRSVFMGLAFGDNHTLYASEGNSGRVRELNPSSGTRRRVYDLNGGGFSDSYTGDLAFDSARGLLYVVDQANFRLVAIDTRSRRTISSVRLGRVPFAVALSPDGRKAYVTNIGMFEYRGIPGADPKRARETGLPFPAFGFPSPESLRGVRRQTEAGAVEVSGLGDPNVRESNSLAVVNVEDPARPRLEAFVRTGSPFGGEIAGGSSPSGVVATSERVYVSNGHNDSITVVDARTNQVAGEIPIRIPGLENLRGVLPIGMAFHQPSRRLLVAEAGINAIGVINTETLKVLGHLPAAWFPTRVLIHGDSVYVTNAKGLGAGPNADFAGNSLQTETFLSVLRRGAISIFSVGELDQLAERTRLVLAMNGFIPRVETPRKLPPAIRHVVLIVKENRTFDEVFGDLGRAANDVVRGAPALARFGPNGFADGGGKRLSIQNVNVAPNHRAMAQRWAFSDNFYADSEVSVDGHHWLVGAYPNAWTESTLMAAYAGQKDFRFPTTAPGRLLFTGGNSSVHPEEQLEAGTLWHHLERHGIRFRNYGEGFELAGADEGPGLEPTGARFLTNVPMPDPLYRNTSRRYPMFNMNIPDEFRATAFIDEVGGKYLRGGEPFPRFLFLHLPNDHMAAPRPEDGYPYQASFVADNDHALGRIVEFLSSTPWWKEMAIFITEDDAQGGRDHVDAHRTVLLVVSPYAQKNYVSHVHSSFPGLLKTAFRLLGIPPLNLFDAAASDLSDCFTTTPDFSPYKALPVDPRLFEPGRARKASNPGPSPRLDDPRVIREQHRGAGSLRPAGEPQ